MSPSISPRDRSPAARIVAALAALLLAAAASTGCGDGDAAVADPPPAAAAPDELTPVVAVPAAGAVVPVPGSDGRVHVVYELRLTNARPVAATIRSVEARDAASGRSVGRVEGAALLASLRTLDNRFATTAQIETNGSRLLLLHLVFDTPEAVPAALVHRLQVLGGSIDASDPSPVAQTYAAGRVAVGPGEAVVLGPPLEGRHWVALNGCCEPTSVHRNTGLPVNGDIRFAQRFAIDFMRLDDRGRLLAGSADDATHYTAYGAAVLAVADGTVVAALDTLDDQVPPSLPDPATVTLATADGNHVVLDIGGGRHAFYAHLQKGAAGVRVRVGDRVVRGQRIGTLGNSGNTSAPHLHFHVMDGPSVLGSSGLPFVIDAYRQSGLITPEMAAAGGLGPDFSAALHAAPQERRRSLPLDFTVVDFVP